MEYFYDVKVKNKNPFGGFVFDVVLELDSSVHYYLSVGCP